MLIENKETEFIKESEKSYSFFELEEIELANGDKAEIKKLVDSIKKSSLLRMKDDLELRLSKVNEKIDLIESLESEE